MANHVRCEEDVELDGTVYRLQLSINGMCEVEAALSTPEKFIPWSAFLTDHLASGALSYTRLLVWAALYQHHPEKTVEFAGQLIDAIGLTAMSEKLLTLVRGTQPDEADLKRLKVKPPDPRTARHPGVRGTGGRLNTKPARSGSPPAPSAG